jgi:hypothetical protein
MKIEYELNIDDLVAFSMYYVTHSPQMKRRVRVRKVLNYSFAALSLLAAILFLLYGALPVAIYFFILCLFIIVYYLLTQFNMRKRIRKDLNKIYGQGRNDIIGKHELSIT